MGPTALVGYVIGWLIWPLRVDSYSKLWMPILGAVLALMIGSTVRQIVAARRAKSDVRPSGPTRSLDEPVVTPTLTPAEVN